MAPDPHAHPSRNPEPIAYSCDAAAYDRCTCAYEHYRRRLVELLPLESDEVVIDVGCGTGLCFRYLQERIGPGGTIVGVERSREMLALAGDRVAAHGWSNVRLVAAAAEEAELPQGADHALFCAVHDVLQSPRALDHVLAHLRPGAAVAAGGGKWAAPWAVALNLCVLAAHAPYVHDFTGFDRPWALLAERVRELAVQEVAMGGGYLASGRLS